MTDGPKVKPSLVKAIAESIGISSLQIEASKVLAPDVEYRVRDILQVCAVLPSSVAWSFAVNINPLSKVQYLPFTHANTSTRTGVYN
jgi:hypothetical protein